MTEEKKKPEENGEVSEEELEDVSGGIIDIDTKKKIVRSANVEEEEEGPVQT